MVLMLEHAELVLMLMVLLMLVLSLMHHHHYLLLQKLKLVLLGSTDTPPLHYSDSVEADSNASEAAATA